MHRHRRPILIISLLVVMGSALTAGSAGAKTIWLCRPGLKPDPCRLGLSTTVYSPRLRKLRVTHPRAVKHPRIDCFYVYPTVSQQTTRYSNRRIQVEERAVARYQAARYSQYCRVFAPMYRQLTLAALDAGTPVTPATLKLPEEDVQTAFATYLRHYNHGRGFVLIGHSQGSFMLESLIQRMIDRRPALRRRMLSAIILGGNLLVKSGHRAGGMFKHVPACASASELGCVIAYSTFDQTPPGNTLFGRSPIKGEQVLCVNPAALLHRRKLDPIGPSKPFPPDTALGLGNLLLGLTLPTPPTVWYSLPSSYQGHCASEAGSHVLEIKALGGAQTPHPSPDATWGLHLLDAQIELGDLLQVVHREISAYSRKH